MEYKTKFFPTRTFNLPDFICIGAQKAGTTWLYENLKCNSQVFLTSKKELHYFDSEPMPKPSVYGKQFNLAKKEQKLGDITPAYSILKENKIKAIYKLIPNVRLIFILRNPVERAWSHAIMNLATQKGRAVNEVDEQEFYAHFKSKASIDRTSYLKCIDSYLCHFSKDQLLIAFYEEISLQPKALLTRVFDFIGVNVPSDWENYPYDKIIHKGIDVEVPYKYQTLLKTQYETETFNLRKRFGSFTVNW